MDALTPMTPEMAERFLARQRFEERLHVSIEGKHGGFQSVPVLSADEFYNVTRALQPVFAIDVLARWVAGQLGDASLAAALERECDGLAMYEQCRAAAAMMRGRTDEAHDVLGDRAEAQAQTA